MIPPAGAPLHGVDVLLSDLDGVVYAAAEPIPGAVPALNRAAEAGVRVGYLTNNASRTDAQVAEQLRALGLTVGPADVVTSPQAAVALLQELVPAPATVLVVGGEGIVVELERAGYRATRTQADAPAAVVQGFHPSVGWEQLAEAAFVIQSTGVPWIATNQDWTYPHSRGVAPGNGTLVSAVHTATGMLPIVAGKPEPAIFETARRRFGAGRTLMIGDRLDTDVLGARRAGMASALVLTGIDGARQLFPAAETERPDFVLADLGELFEPYPQPEVERVGSGAVVRVRGAAVSLDGRRVQVVEAGDPTDLIRAATQLIWGLGVKIYALELAPALMALAE